MSCRTIAGGVAATVKSDMFAQQRYDSANFDYMCHSAVPEYLFFERLCLLHIRREYGKIRMAQLTEFTAADTE